MAGFRSRYVGTERVRILDIYEEKLRLRLWAVLGKKAAELLARARAAVQGRVLHVKSGDLLDSIQSEPFNTEKGFGYRIFSDSFIGRFWETGFGKGKAFQVKAHVRRVKAGSATGIVKSRTLKTRTRITFGQTAQGIAFVKAHSRKINQKPRSFLRASLNAMRADIRSELAAAVRG